MARILVSLSLKCSIVSQSKKRWGPGIKDFPSRVQGFGGEILWGGRARCEPQRLHFSPGSQSKARQTEQEIVSLSVKTRREKCKWPSQ